MASRTSRGAKRAIFLIRPGKEGDAPEATGKNIRETLGNEREKSGKAVISRAASGGFIQPSAQTLDRGQGCGVGQGKFVIAVIDLECGEFSPLFAARPVAPSKAVTSHRTPKCAAINRVYRSGRGGR